MGAILSFIKVNKIYYLFVLHVSPRSTETLIHLLKGNIGPGILNMPEAFLYSGLYVGLMGVSIIGIICLHCTQLLVRSRWGGGLCIIFISMECKITKRHVSLCAPLAINIDIFIHIHIYLYIHINIYTYKYVQQR